MVLADVQVIKGDFDAEQRREMARKLADAKIGIEGGAMLGVTWVRVHEVTSVNGASASSEYFKAMAAAN